MVLSKRIIMEAKKIKVVKDWPEPKSVHDIQVFLSFAKFYWQFIQNFNRIAALLILMLKTTRSPNKPTFSRIDGNKSTSSKNDNSRPIFRKNDDNNKVDGFSIGKNDMEHAKKLGKLSKLGISRSKNMSQSQNSAKSRKKLLKIGN